MTQYVNEYGTTYAVQEYKGEPRIMCRAKDGSDWLVSGTLAVVAAAAKTIVDVQDVLDNHARTHGWRPVEAPSSAEPPEIVDEGSGPEDGCPYLQPLENSRKYACQCSICKEKFVSKETCNKSYRTCGWYLDKQEKNAAPPVADDGFPDWVQPMAAEFLQFDFVRALPAFTATELKNSDPVQHYQGGSIADHGLYDTGPKGIKFTVLLSNRYLEKYYTWPDFVRRCKAAGLAPEPLHQDKEDAPCNEEQPTPTGDAAATTDGSAAVSTAETTTTSESGAGANSCGTPVPAAQPSNAPPAELAPTAPTNLPAFDYSGLDDQTVAVLHLAESEIREARQAYISRLSAAVAAAHEAVVANCENGAGGRFIKPEGTFFAWCASVGLKKDAAYRLLQINALFNRATAAEQAVLENASHSLLYAAAKPSAPPELVQAVKDGDITTHKQYQDLLARYNAERAAREQAEQECNQAIASRDAARDAQVNLSNISDKIAKQRDDALKQRDDANRRATEAEKQRDGARDALQAAKLRGDKLKAENDALKAQPVEAKVIDEEEVDRRAKARAAELTAPLREELEALRNRHPADPEAAEQAIRDAYDSAIYTGRVMENAWHTLRPLLPRMDADRRELALNQIINIISSIQGECIACL